MSSESSVSSKNTRNGGQKNRAKSQGKWQARLLPTMAGILIGLTIFFFVASFIQMSYLHWSIINYPEFDSTSMSTEGLIANAGTFDEQLTARRLEIFTRMEAYVISRRHHHASVIIMSGLWIRYLGFVTGMILALVGAAFVLGKLREPASAISGKLSGFDLSLRSASPGIILAVLGAALMFATIIDKDVYEVKDAPVYISNFTDLDMLDISTPTSLPPLDIPSELIFPPVEDTPVSPP